MDRTGSAVTSRRESTGTSAIAGGGVSNDISSVPQADASRLSAMNRTAGRRIQFSFKMDVKLNGKRQIYPVGGG